MQNRNFGPIMIFPKKKIKDQLAFGVIPAYRKYQLRLERYRSASEIVKSKISLDENSKILDVGCGEGSMSYFLKDVNPQWTGVEVWKERAELCRSLGYDVHELDLNKTDFPFEDNQYEVVFASHVLEHLARLDLAVQEMARVLKPGGLLMIATPIKLPPVPALINLYYANNDNDLGATQQAFSLWSLKGRIRKILGSDFELVDCRGFRILSSRRRFNLEDQLWFYRTNTWIGRNFPAITPEVNLFFRKKG